MTLFADFADFADEAGPHGPASSIPGETPAKPVWRVAAMQHVLSVSDSSFARDVIQSPVPVLVRFWARWSTPSRSTDAIVDPCSPDFRRAEAYAQPHRPSDRPVKTFPSCGRQNLIRPINRALR